MTCRTEKTASRRAQEGKADMKEAKDEEQVYALLHSTGFIRRQCFVNK